MAFYTPQSLPRTPSVPAMNSFPSITPEFSILSRLPKPQHHTPITPPMTCTFERRKMSPSNMTTLPPIAYLDRQLSDRHMMSTALPLTPPDDEPPHYSPPTRLPPIVDYSSSEMCSRVPEPVYSKHHQPLFVDANLPVEWLDFTQKRSAHFIAEKTCEMICYLWFSTPPQDSHSYPSPPSNPNSSTLFNRPNSATTLQLVATPTFVSFMQKLLETTQVSQSVIVLSLHYIFRLKERNRFTPAQAGSEFRIAVAGLMMANKFLDDNTYTNKTWSEVSGIDLTEINRMEREFLMGVDCNLYVDKPTYESWLNLLKGLVLAKERDSRHFRKSRTLARASRHPSSHLTTTPCRYTARGRVSSHRARSTSPEQTRTYVSLPPQYASHAPAPQAAYSEASPSLRPGAKRTAEAAFSPTSASFSHIPSKRPVSITLQIPESGNVGGTNSSSYSPLEGLQSFSKMSIDSPARPTTHTNTGTPSSTSSWSSYAKSHSTPETLVTAYALDERRRSVVPQNLYFYTLACSPMEDDESRSRKARLRVHQPLPPSSSAPCYQPRPSIPINVQSASTSPNDVHISVAPPTLPHFHDTVWTRPPESTPYTASHHYQHHHHHMTAPPLPPPALIIPNVEPPRYQQYYSSVQQQQGYERDYDESSPVQSAPFANAGPPGVQFYPTPSQKSSPLYVPPLRNSYWNRRSVGQ